MGVKVSGLSAVVGALESMHDAADALDEGVEAAAQKVKAKAVTKAPRRTGFLRSTGEAVQITTAVWRIQFTAKYALAVHEKTEINYQNGDAKYLENALDEVVGSGEAASLITNTVADSIFD